MAANGTTATAASSAPERAGAAYMTDVKDEFEALHKYTCLTLTGVGGTANTITASRPLTLANQALQEGQQFILQPTATNTGAVTINIDSQGAKNLLDRNGLTLLAGMLVSGSQYYMVYKGGSMVLLALERGLIGRQSLWLSVADGEIYTRTTNGAAANTRELTTNKNMIKSLDFDATTQEFAQFMLKMSSKWDLGTMSARFVWSHSATTVNFGVRVGLQLVAISNDDSEDAAYGTGQAVTDTGGTTNDIYVTDETAAITVSGSPTADDLLLGQIYRDPAHAGDTNVADMRLIGMQLFYTTSTAVEA